MNYCIIASIFSYKKGEVSFKTHSDDFFLEVKKVAPIFQTPPFPSVFFPANANFRGNLVEKLTFAIHLDPYQCGNMA